MQTIYISGQITGLKESIYTMNFYVAETNLLCKRTQSGELLYSQVINPLKIKPFLGIKRWLFYMITDLWVLIFKCDCIYMLKNWKVSKGARIEYKVAIILKKKIIFE